MTETKLDIALRWLYRHLRDGSKLCGNRRKPIPGTAYGDGIQAGIAGMTLRRAADTLKVKREKVGGLWYWSLPEGYKPPKPAVTQPKHPVRKRRPRRLVITIAFE